MSKCAVKLGEFERRQCGYKVRELALEHQCKKIAADGGSPRQSIFWSKHDLRCKTENFSVNWGADHGRDIFVLGDKGSRNYDVKTGFCSTLGNPLARSVDLAAPHERDCSVMSTRAWRARRLRCFRNTAPSLASVSRLVGFSHIGATPCEPAPHGFGVAMTFRSAHPTALRSLHQWQSFSCGGLYQQI